MIFFNTACIRFIRFIRFICSFVHSFIRFIRFIRCKIKTGDRQELVDEISNNIYDANSCISKMELELRNLSYQEKQRAQKTITLLRTSLRFLPSFSCCCWFPLLSSSVSPFIVFHFCFPSSSYPIPKPPSKKNTTTREQERDFERAKRNKGNNRSQLLTDLPANSRMNDIDSHSNRQRILEADDSLNVQQDSLMRSQQKINGNSFFLFLLNRFPFPSLSLCDWFFVPPLRLW